MVMAGRTCILGEVSGEGVTLSETSRVVRACWSLIPQHLPAVELGAFVVMPNHVHGILMLRECAGASAPARRGTIHRAPTERFGRRVARSIPTIVRTDKAAVTRAARQNSKVLRTVWQRGYYEHVIRDGGEWDRFERYIQTNPVNWAEDDENPQPLACARRRSP